MLSVSGLCKSFGKRRAVDGVSFQVQRGQTVGLLGPNGAGKSTTVSMICGLISADSGSVTLDGMPIGQGASSAKAKLGLVPQDLALYEDLPAIGNLKLFGALYGLSGAALARRAEEVLALVGLSDRARDKPSTFSGGMKRRLNIGAALLHDPQLLILDEPTVGVDPQSRNAIFETLETLKAQGRSLIYTSHYMEEVERLADHIVIIDHGKVLADASPEELYRRLPGQAALQVELAASHPAAGAGAAAQAAAESLVAALATQAGVAGIRRNGAHFDISLHDSAHAARVLRWLDEQGHALAHFSTARTKLEDIFLTLTGRSLRD